MIDFVAPEKNVHLCKLRFPAAEKSINFRKNVADLLGLKKSITDRVGIIN